MDEKELVKKAIANKAVPLVERVSDEDLKRYAIPTRNYRVPLSPYGEFPVHASNVAPEKWTAMDWGGDHIFTEYPMLEPNHSRTVSAVDAMRDYMMSAMMYSTAPAMFGGGMSRHVSTAILEAPPEIPRPSKDILKRFTVTEQNVTDMRSELAAEAEALLGYSVLRKRLGMQSPLTTALLKLEIEPFDSKSVDEYKKQMLAYAQNEAARMDVAEGIKPGSWQARIARWQEFSINGYSKPIPEYAIEKALQVKKACPEVSFKIEELTIVPDPFLIAVLGKVRRYIEVWDEPKFEGQ
jgi:hypothetical protein